MSRASAIVFAIIAIVSKVFRPRDFHSNMLGLGTKIKLITVGCTCFASYAFQQD